MSNNPLSSPSIHIDPKWLDERHADMKERVDKLETNCGKLYATKDRVYACVGGAWVALATALCCLYLAVNGAMIDSRVERFNTKLDHIIELLAANPE